MEETNKTITNDPLGILAVVFGVIGIITSSTVFIGFLAGTVAITCGALSRLHKEKFYNKNVVGIILGIISLYATGVYLLSYIELLKDPEALKQIEQMLNNFSKNYSGQ